MDPSTGAICVNTLKKDWSPTVTMSHVLGVIRCLLIVPFPESSLNDEAGKLFMESYEEYAQRARLMASIHGRPKSLYDNSTHDATPSSPKSKENEGNPSVLSRMNPNISPNDVLKQSSAMDANSISLEKSVKAIKKKSTSGDVKKKKNLKRL